MKQRRTWLYVRLTLAFGAVLCAVLLHRFQTRNHPPAMPPPAPLMRQDVLSSLTTWPWPNAKQEKLPGNVTHWEATAAEEGTRLDLFDFDFGQNSHLRLEIFDQDQDDASPFDNHAAFWERGVGQITRQRNEQFQSRKQGQVLAAWNGLFFSPDRYGVGAVAEHVSPIVLDGKPRYTDVTYRWTFGVKMENGKAVFKTLHTPDRNALAREFDWAAGGAQCLIKDGAPLALQPFPAPGAAPLHGPVPSTTKQAGHIPVVDHIKTSRVSLGWSKDNRHLFLLFVQDPDTEASSAIQFRHGQVMRGGWMLSDLQRFWQAKGVWGAINSDGGDLAQMTYLRGDGSYMLVPPMISGANARRVVSPQFENAPAGGTLMYLYIRDMSLP